MTENKGDLIKRNLAIAYATSGLIRKIDGEDWIRISEVKQSLNDAPTVEQEVYMTGEDYDLYMKGYNQARKDFRPQGEWVRKEDVIHSIAKQYSEHNELVPVWLTIGDMRGKEND